MNEKSFNSENCDKPSNLKLFTTSYMFPCNFNNECLHNVWRHEICDKLLTVYNFKWARKFQEFYARPRFPSPMKLCITIFNLTYIIWRFMRRRNIIKYHTTNCHICLNLRIQNLLSTLYYVHSRVYYVKNKDVQTWDIFYLCVDLVCVFVFVWGYQAIRGLNFFSKSIL